MHTETGHDPREFLREGGDDRPFPGVGAVDDGAPEPDAVQVGVDRGAVRGQRVEMKMLVGVVKGGHGAKSATNPADANREIG